MLVSNISDLPRVEELAIIINVETKYVTTLALLSTLRHARVPALVVDCESRDRSFDWFRELMRDHDFHLMSAPLREHGENLDGIFRQVPADCLLLVDSDVELIADEMVRRMRGMLMANEHMYGSGSLHQADWFKFLYPTDLPIAPGIGYFMERPWMPFALIRVPPVRLALSKGRSFNYRLVLNEFPSIPALSRLLWKRFRFEFFRQRRLAFLDPIRGTREGVKPAYFWFDTGGDIHEYLTRDLGFQFGSVDPGLVPWSVTHLDGVTRKVLDGRDVANVLTRVTERLRTEYGITVAPS